MTKIKQVEIKKKEKKMAEKTKLKLHIAIPIFLWVGPGIYIFFPHIQVYSSGSALNGVTLEICNSTLHIYILCGYMNSQNVSMAVLAQHCRRARQVDSNVNDTLRRDDYYLFGCIARCEERSHK